MTRLRQPTRSEKRRVWLDCDPASKYPCIEAAVAHYIDLEKTTFGSFRASVRCAKLTVPFIVVFEYARSNGTYAIWVPQQCLVGFPIWSCRILPSRVVVPGATIRTIEQQEHYYRLAAIYDEFMPTTGRQRTGFTFIPSPQEHHTWSIYAAGTSPFEDGYFRKVKGYSLLATALAELELYKFLDKEATESPHFEFHLFEDAENERLEYKVKADLPNVEFLVRAARPLTAKMLRREGNEFIARFISWVFGGKDG
jgi:hypothetical protein